MGVISQAKRKKISDDALKTLSPSELVKLDKLMEG
jgi:hypothetical protein